MKVFCYLGAHAAEDFHPIEQTFLDPEHKVEEATNISLIGD